jgi:glycosyltransferase involved in cell wall biosynthesis
MISICLVTQNNEATLEDTLNSIALQTYSNFECIIVDEFSSDNTLNIISDICKKDARFKLYVNVCNVSEAYTDAHNKAYRLASGKYLFRVNADDVLLDNHVECLVEYMNEHLDVDICSSSVVTASFDNGSWVKGEKPEYPERRINLLRKYPIVYIQDTSWNCLPEMFNTASSVIRKESFYKYNLNYCKNSEAYADNIFWRFAAAKGAKFDYVDEVTVVCKGKHLPTHKIRKPIPYSDYYCALANFMGYSLYLDKADEFAKEGYGNIVYSVEIYLNTIMYFMKILVDTNSWDNVESELKYISPQSDKI